MSITPQKEFTVLQPSVAWEDPHAWTDATDSLSVRAAAYEALVQYAPGGHYKPVLASSWRIAPDARTWTFYLQPDVPFHDGETLQARDVVSSLARACAPDAPGLYGTGGLCHSYLGDASVKALDAHSVQIVTPEPMADLLDLLFKIPIVSQHALDDLSQRSAGTGPYQLLSAQDAGVVTMARFDDYWAGRPPVQRLHWRAETDTAQRVSALLSGDADLVTQVSLEERQFIETMGQAEVVTADGHLAVIFMCNAHSGPCAEQRVRQALNYALDMSRIIYAIKGGAAQPLNGPLTPSHLGYDPETSPYPYDLGKARALLAAAGYADGMTLTLDVPTHSPDEANALAQHMANQYARIGITVEIKTFSDRPAYAERVKAKQINDACAFDSSPLSTYRCLREKFHSGVAGSWWQGYDNPEVNALLERAWATVDDAQRQAIYRRAYRIIRDDAPWIFFYSPTDFWGVGPRARGWSSQADGLVRLI
jgi:peptide/nickel transport system substrate-binding protein